MLEILDNNKRSNLNNINSSKSSPLSSYNLRSPYKLRTAQTTRSNIDINKCLPI